jgi:hypothetical protein
MEQPQATPMDGASTMPNDLSMNGEEPMMGEQPPMDGQDQMMGEQPPMNGQDQMMDEQPPIDDNAEGDDSTISIINQLSDEDREAVRAYAESMLNKSGEGGEYTEEVPMEGGEPMMESFIFTKKQLNKLMENFGPSEDEIQNKNDDRKPLSKKKEKTVSYKSPFNSPKFN